MNNTLKRLLLSLIPLLFVANICFGHACDDPWRPDPSNAGGPSGGGSTGPVAPPPPPPAPGEAPPPAGGGPSSPSNPNVPTGANLGLMNQLPNKAMNSGSGADMSPDNIVLIPETSQLKIVGKKGEFRTYIVNRSPRDLFAVKLEAISSAFTIKVFPETIRRLVSGEKDYFTVKLKVKGKLKSGKFPMDFKVSSRGTLIYEGSLGKTNKKKKVAKENLGIRLKTKVVTIAGTGSFTMYIKNNIYNQVNGVKVEVNSKYFEVKATPRSVSKLSPGREAKFTITLTPKKGLKPGSYDIRLHALTSSRNVKSNKIITIKVLKKPANKM